MPGPIAPPSLPPPRKTPNAVERRSTGIHRPNAELTAGERQASIAPNTKRIASREIRLHAAAVNPVNSDQPIIPSETMARAPKRSAAAPQGAWKMAYERLNALNTCPICNGRSEERRVGKEC